LFKKLAQEQKLEPLPHRQRSLGELCSCVGTVGDTTAAQIALRHIGQSCLPRMRSSPARSQAYTLNTPRIE
jgi:hypothetical protein